MSSPRFIFFDLGNVLLYFSYHRATRQMAEVAGISAERVWEIIFGSDLELRYERGDISTEQFYDEFCQSAGVQPDCAALLEAGADIFELNVSMAPLIASLKGVGYRLGILSNTQESHWNLIRDGRYGLIRYSFESHVLSYQVGALKPEPQIYAAAIEQAGVAADEIFFIDDRPENVAGARAAGLDAVRFVSARQLADDLRSRGVMLNY